MNKKTGVYLKNFCLAVLMIFMSFSIVANDIELLTVTDYHQDSLVRLSENTILVIELDSAVAAGYNWYQANDNSRNFLTQLGEPLNKESRSSLYGQTTTVQLFFQAEARSFGTLTLELKRIWETAEAPLKTFSINVQADAPFRGSFTPPAAPEIEMTEDQLRDTDSRDLPAQFNWCGTSFNQCPPCKNQGSTNACWSFCTVAAFECALGSTTTKYSEQFLINCNKDGYTAASGGFPCSKYHCDTLAKTQTQAGAVNSTTVPWTGYDGTCSGPYAVVKKLVSYGNVITGTGVPTVAQIKQALYDHGPIACGVYADSKMQSYSGGVFTASSGTANHCVTLVGWNDTDGAWYMRNSWGTSWGENGGYMRIKWGTGQIGSRSEYINAGSQANCQAGFNFTTDFNNLTAVFTDTSSCSQGSITGWNWKFGDSTTSTLKNPNHTYSTAGSYSVTLTVTDSSAQTYSASKTVTVPKQLEYCASASTDYSAFYINNVKLGTLNNSSQGSTYTDFTSVTAPQLELGQNYTLTITITTAQYTNWFKAYIDYNRDGDFTDAGEVVYVIPEAQKVASAGGTITIPTTATPGLTRMRVQVKNITSTPQPAPEPCETFTYGEVEDYTVNIIQAANTPPVADFTFTTNQLTATFTDASTDAEGTIKSWAWNFGDGSTSTLKNPSRTYTSAGTYNVTLTVTDQGNLTNAKTKAVTVSIANTPPVADFTFSTNQLTATFTDASTDAEGTIKSWAWKFGDGSTSTLKNPSRTYSSAGTYSVTLTVTDQGNLTNSKVKPVTVSTSPTTTDDIIGVFPSTGGLWNMQNTGSSFTWTRLSLQEPDMIRMGDVDGNGKDDLGCFFKADQKFWIRYDNGNWVDVPASAKDMICFDLGDLNKDGQADIVGSWTFGTWWKNTASGVWSKLSTMSPTYLAAGDFDGDGYCDMVGLYPTLSSLWIYQYNGNKWTQISKQINLNDLRTGDFDNDGKYEVLGSWDIGTWTFNPLTNAWVKHSNNQASVLCAGDINGLGKDDIVGDWTPSAPGLWIKYLEDGLWKEASKQVPTDLTSGKTK
jgi:PKD repeat protein/predicted secreted protein